MGVGVVWCPGVLLFKFQLSLSYVPLLLALFSNSLSLRNEPRTNAK